jgi:hypothetical protein
MNFANPARTWSSDDGTIVVECISTLTANGIVDQYRATIEGNAFLLLPIVDSFMFLKVIPNAERGSHVFQISVRPAGRDLQFCQWLAPCLMTADLDFRATMTVTLARRESATERAVN